MVTILDVAKHAQVSKSTVSLVVNDSPLVREETRQRVLESIRELGYTPNISARSLISKKTNNLGVLMLTENVKRESYDFDIETDLFSYDVISGIPEILLNTDYGLLNEQFCIFDSEQKLPQLIKTHRVDGLFIVGSLIEKEFSDLIRKTGIPAVVLGREHDCFDSVTADVKQGAKAAALHLIQTGHKKLCYINCPVMFSTNRLRKTGFYQAVEEEGGSLVHYMDVDAEHNSGIGGYEAMKKVWESGERPDGVLAANDGIALGILRYFYENKIRVPEDVSMVSYEDSILSGYASPALSTIDIGKRRMGMEACRLLLDRIEDPDRKKESVVLPVRLVERDSVIRRN